MQALDDDGGQRGDGIEQRPPLSGADLFGVFAGHQQHAASAQRRGQRQRQRGAVAALFGRQEHRPALFMDRAHMLLAALATLRRRNRNQGSVGARQIEDGLDAQPPPQKAAHDVGDLFRRDGAR
jgi:hypothetical protein